MIADNATSSSRATGPIESPVCSAPQPRTALSRGLLTTANGSSIESRGLGRVAGSYSSQPEARPSETTATSQAEAANLWQRVQNYFSSPTAIGEFVTEWTQGAKANTHRASLEKAILHFYVNQRLMAQGVNAEDLHEAIEDLVEKMLATSPALNFAKVVQGLVEKIHRGHQTPQTVIERFPVKDYVRVAKNQQVIPSQPSCRQQTMEALVCLLQSLMMQPMHRAGTAEHHAGKSMAAPQISRQTQEAVQQVSLVPVPADLSPWQARAGALTKEGPRKTIVNKQQTTAFGPSGVMADEMLIEVGESERETLLPGFRSAVLAFASRALVKVRNSPGVTVMVAAGTAASCAAYLVYEKVMASPPRASDAAIDVTPPAVTDMASVPDVQQSGNRTSNKEEFGHVPRPNTGYRRSDSAEEAERLHKSELDELNLHPKKLGPPYRPSEEKD